MSHYAIVPKGDSVKLAAKVQTKDIRKELTDIYQSYAEAYPNPRLIEENQERDRLLRAISAASHAEELNPPKKRKGGLLSFLWGSSKEEKETTTQVPSLEASDDDSRLIYSEFDDGEEDDSLCGTKYSLDTSCIPEEAHSFARFHLASTRTRGERPNVARSSWERPGKTVIIITRLGELVEFRNGEKARVHFTSDREDLLEFNEKTGSGFRLAYSRAATVGPNFLIVSWGMMDGFVVFYRRLAGREDTVWEAVAVLGPTEAVRENVGDVFLDETDSSLLRVTDVLPLVVETGKIPAATLAVSRLGGYIELVPLPHRLWYGPEIQEPGDKHRKRKRRKSPHVHYAVGKLPDLAANQSAVTALTTSEYHGDVIGLEAFRTRVDEDSTWNTNLYPNAPPAEHVLAAFGTRNGNESISFWTVSTLFSEGAEPGDDIGFSLHASLTEALELGPVGPDISIFANSTIMRYWRRPRSVELREAVETPLGENEEPVSEKIRVTTVSISAPVVAVRFIVSEGSVQLAVLDFNGGATLMDCGLLERTASQSLSDNEYDLIFKDEDSGAIVPLAKNVVDRTRMSLYLSTIGSLSTKIADIRWLSAAVPGATEEDPSVAILTNNPCRFCVFSAKDAERRTPAVSIPFDCEHGVFLNNLGSEDLILVAFDDMLSVSENCLSLCAMRQLDPLRIVESFFREAKCKEAIAAAKHLNFEDQKAVSDVVESCRKQLWEKTRKLDILVEICDDSYVLKQALSFSNPHGSDGLALFKSVHQVALQRVENARLGPSLAITGLHGTKAIVAELRERLIKLGTYNLLCRYFPLDPSASQFLDEFLPASIQDIARNFAKEADVLALSILWFRHRDDVMEDFRVLDEIPLTVEPQLIQHLFPVPEKQHGIAHFLSSMTDRHIQEWANMPKYLGETLDLIVALDKEDEKLVLDSCLDRERVADTVEGKCSLLQWYAARARAIQDFSGSLHYSADFVEMAFIANGIDRKAADMDHPPEELSELYRILNCTEALRNLLVDQMEDDLAPLPSTTLRSGDLERMDLPDFVGLLLGSQRDPAEFFQRFSRSVRPLLDTFVGSSGDCNEKSLEDAITSYCMQLLKECSSGDVEAELHQALRRALDVSSSVASMSRTSIPAKDRLVKDRACLVHFVFSFIFYTIEASRRTAITDSDLRYTIKVFWALYEALPMISFPPERDDQGFVEKADRVFVGLVAADIVSEWPGCDALTVMNDLIVDTEGGSVHKLQESGHRIVSYLCRSFCAQVGNSEATGEHRERSELLSSLMSDVDELDRICYGGSLPVARLLSRFLFEPLLRQRQIHLLNDFLTNADDAYVDKAWTSKAIASYVNEAVFADGDGRDQDEILRAVMSIQDNLGHWFPELETEFVTVRRYVDAAHFINTIVLPESRMAALSPEDLRKQLPLDVIESILDESPKSIVCDCQEWEQEESARLANATLREHFERRSAGDGSSERASLPPLPGRAILHVAELLGLSGDGDMIAVKCRVVSYSLLSGLFGAAAAVCRTLILDSSEAKEVRGAAPVLEAVASTVTQPAYADIATKRELCVAALGKSYGHLSSAMLSPYDRLMKAFIVTEQQYSETTREGTVSESLVPSVERLYRDTAFEYSANLRELFAALQLQSSDCTVDDSLLNALSRYTAFWCISQSTRVVRTDNPSEHQRADTQSVLALASSLILHISNVKLSHECLQEVRKVLEEQAALAMSQKPSDLVPKTWDEDVVRRLVGRGYSELAARRACTMSQNGTFDAALQWAVSHSLDKDFDDPILLLKPHDGVFTDYDGISRLQATLSFLGGLISEGKNTQLVTAVSTPTASSVPHSVPKHEESGIVASVARSWYEEPRPDATASEPIELPPQGMHQESRKSTITELNRTSTRKSASKTQIHGSSKGGRLSAAVTPVLRPSTGATVSPELLAPKPPEQSAAKPGSKPTESAVNPDPLAKLVNPRPHAKASIKSNRATKLTVPTRTGPIPEMKSDSKLTVSKRLLPQQRQGVPTPARSSLRERGQTVLNQARSTGSPADEERRRLIEEGRRLLRKARSTKSGSAEEAAPKASSRATTATHRYPLRSRTARTERQKREVGPGQETSPSTRVAANGEPRDEINDGWDDFDVDI